MPHYFFIWTDENASHIAEHGVTQDEFEAVVCNSESTGDSRSSGLPIAFGFTADVRYWLNTRFFLLPLMRWSDVKESKTRLQEADG